MSNKDSVSILERVIIMLFGVGIVMLGLYPLSRDYGGISKFVKSKVETLSQRVGNISDWEKSDVARAKLAEQRPEPKKSLPAGDRGKKNKKSEIDNKDREELDNLIDKVWQ